MARKNNGVPTRFVRFGGLSSVRQTHFGKNPDSFHTPPRKKGIYAMPWPYYDRFLLGATNDPKKPHGKAMWLRDDNGGLIPYNDIADWDIMTCSNAIKSEYASLAKRIGLKASDISSEEKDGKYYATRIVKPRIFTYAGEIWHHLVTHTEHSAKLGEVGTWVLTTFDDYQRAFDAMRHAEARDLHKDIKWRGDPGKYDLKWQLTQTNPFRRSFPGWNLSRDHLEVFIERV